MTTPSQLPAAGWERRRLLLVLAGVLAAALVLVAGLGYSVRLAVTNASAADPAPLTTEASIRSVEPQVGTGVRGAAYRDQLAAEPMLTVTAADARPGTPAATLPPAIVVPEAIVVDGPGGVPTGFPHSPAGAVGQLAAIETTVLEEMSIAGVNRVYDAWALPGGVGVTGWELTRDVQAFLGTAGMGSARDVASSVVATPMGALVKGVDGPDWTLACVLLEVRATITATSRIAYGHCERMQWEAGRWMIAPGAPPAAAPSTWPGTDIAARAGWATWTTPATSRALGRG